MNEFFFLKQIRRTDFSTNESNEDIKTFVIDFSVVIQIYELMDSTAK